MSACIAIMNDLYSNESDLFDTNYFDLMIHAIIDGKLKRVTIWKAQGNIFIEKGTTERTALDVLPPLLW